MRTARSMIAKFSALTLAMLQAGASWAAGNGTTAGLTLLEAPSARAYGIAQAMSSVSNDVAAFAYNPAALSSLRSGQASFLYQKGLVDDAYGQFQIGRPSPRGGYGLSIGYYNGGEMELHDGAGGSRNVTAQRDLSVSLGYAGRAGRWGWGLAGKYLSSEIIEQAKAAGFAVDMGLRVSATPRLQIGAAVQNLGPTISYVSEKEELPRVARLGASYALPRRSVTTTFLLDGAYRMVEKDVQPALGIEFAFGALVLRTGARRTGQDTEITAGTGFLLGGSNIDYSVGVARETDTTHRISYAFRFGSTGGTNPPLFVRPAAGAHPPLVRKAPSRPAGQATTANAVKPSKRAPADLGSSVGRPVHRVDQVRSVARQPRTYVIRPGDTLASVAKKHYGDYRLWTRIYGANKHLLPDPRQVEVGQKIVLP